MTQITYTREAPNKEIKSHGFTAYRWANFKDTLVIEELWRTIQICADFSFENLCAAVKETYKNKTVKSAVYIHQTEGILEIIKKGVFPNIIVYKNE